MSLQVKIKNAVGSIIINTRYNLIDVSQSRNNPLVNLK